MESRKRTKHKSKGITTGLGICSYFAAIFRANEGCVTKRKKTDEQIAIMIEREFPHKLGAFAFRGETKKRTINEYRHRYNTGKFTGGIVPSIYSFRYNKTGDRVDGRTGTKVLPTIQQHGLASQQRYWHKRATEALQRDS
jgi:hypothetical protein